jgi:hypothetical protein
VPQPYAPLDVQMVPEGFVLSIAHSLFEVNAAILFPSLWATPKPADACMGLRSPEHPAQEGAAGGVLEGYRDRMSHYCQSKLSIPPRTLLEPVNPIGKFRRVAPDLRCNQCFAWPAFVYAATGGDTCGLRSLGNISSSPGVSSSAPANTVAAADQTCLRFARSPMNRPPRVS